MKKAATFFLGLSLVLSFLGTGASSASSFGTSSLPLNPAAPSGSFSSVSAGFEHTCAITNAGVVLCWGINTKGQLGDGTTAPHGTPAAVTSLNAQVSALAAGDGFTCALTASGGVKCWGDNQYGELGDGTYNNSSAPVDVTGLPANITALAAGYSHVCALSSTGGVLCWGHNSFGQLGNGSTTSSPTPVDISGLTSGVTAIAAGGSETCAMTSAGGEKCWGDNLTGQVGDGTFLNSRLTPVDVSGLTSGVASISVGGSDACAVLSTGAVECWGSNIYGEVGNGSTNQSNTPVQVSGLTSGVTGVSAGGGFTCAWTDSGSAKCWGNDDSGQLGDGSTTLQDTPIDVSGLASGVASISTGSSAACALLSSGNLKCWGDNRAGELGVDPKPFLSPTPVDVTGLPSGVLSIAAGFDHLCARLDSGGMDCWGNDNYGQLGDRSNVESSTPVSVMGLGGGAREVALGNGFSCALVSQSQIIVKLGVKCWGGNGFGQLGNGTINPNNTPQFVTNLSDGVSAITAQSAHACAVTTSGGLRCWGDNSDGDLGDGTVTDRTTPVTVFGYATGGAIDVEAGSYFTCARTSSNGVQCWGTNNFGQLGVDPTTTTQSPIPVDVVGLTSGVAQISAGDIHACALTNAGGVVCWGDNRYGQLGNGGTTNSYKPEDVTGLTSGATQIAAGTDTTCALTTSGGVKCWGYNANGELGGGTSDQQSSTPVDVTGLSSGVTQIAVSGFTACALLSTGSVKCWGSDYRGQLGDGRLLQSLTPVEVFPPGVTPPGSFHAFLPVIMTKK